MASAAPRRSVLVIDDEPQVVKTLSRTLERHGYDVVGATSAAEGLARAAELHPDLVISDYRMPQTNGAAVLRALLAEQPMLACILMSGGGDLRDEALPSAVVYLSKPWSLEEVATAALVALHRAKSPDS